MTRLEENVGKAIGALLVIGVGWIGTMVATNNAITMANQVALAENKVLTLEIQKDIAAMRIDVSDIEAKTEDLNSRVIQNEGSIKYLAKEHGL